MCLRRKRRTSDLGLSGITNLGKVPRKVRTAKHIAERSHNSSSGGAIGIQLVKAARMLIKAAGPRPCRFRIRSLSAQCRLNQKVSPPLWVFQETRSRRWMRPRTAADTLPIAQRPTRGVLADPDQQDCKILFRSQKRQSVLRPATRKAMFKNGPLRA